MLQPRLGPTTAIAVKPTIPAGSTSRSILLQQKIRRTRKVVLTHQCMMVLARNNRSSGLSTLNMCLLSSPCSSRRMCLARPLSSLLGAIPEHQSRDNGNRAKRRGSESQTESCHGNERSRSGNSRVVKEDYTPAGLGRGLPSPPVADKIARAYAVCCENMMRSAVSGETNRQSMKKKNGGGGEGKRHDHEAKQKVSKCMNLQKPEQLLIQVHHPKKNPYTSNIQLFHRAQAWGGGGNETEMKPPQVQPHRNGKKSRNNTLHSLVSIECFSPTCPLHPPRALWRRWRWQRLCAAQVP